jgi:hypothetical protein
MHYNMVSYGVATTCKFPFGVPGFPDFLTKPKYSS